MSTDSAHRILVVDDSPTMVEWVRVLLAEHEDLPLTSCTRAELALGVARQLAPTLILQDLVMPGRDGLQLLADYAAEPILRDVPVAILSAIEDAGEKARAFAAGAVDYIVKFPDPIELVARVRAHSVAYQTRVALRQATRLLERAVDNAPIGIARTTLDGRWSHVNDTLCELLGYSRREVLEIGWQGLTHPDDLGLGGKDWARRLLSGEERRTQMEKRYLHRNGHVIWVRVTSSLVRADAGEPSFFVAQIEDITARHRAEAQANTLFESSRDACVIMSPDGTLERVNATWTRILGWEQRETVGKNVCDFLHPDDVANMVEQRRQGATALDLYRNRVRARDGRYRWWEWNAVQADEGLFSIARDITQQVEMEDSLREASLTDELTKLCNRRGFMVLGDQQLAVATRHARALLVVFADVNGMKQINDTLGHDEGDRALIAVADVLRMTFRRGDLMARLAGDEFAVLAEGDAESAEGIKARLGENVVRANAKLQKPYELSISIGVVCTNPEQPQALAELLLTADQRMYEAKRRRRAG